MTFVAVTTARRFSCNGVATPRHHALSSSNQLSPLTFPRVRRRAAVVNELTRPNSLLSNEGTNVPVGEREEIFGKCKDARSHIHANTNATRLSLLFHLRATTSDAPHRLT
jgi:hypothetical protein